MTPRSGALLGDSAIAWLGDIPAYWTFCRLRFFCQAIRTGSTPSQEFIESSTHSESMDWFTPGDFSDSLELCDSGRKVAMEAFRRGEVELFPPGTVFVVGIGATLGKVGFIKETAAANQQINALVLRPNVDCRLLAWSLSVYDDVMRAMANSATLPILNQQRMGDLQLALPPIKEQQEIAVYLERKTAHIDALITAKEHMLGLIAEKRRALISEAVTRGIDPSALLTDSGIAWLGSIPSQWKTRRIAWLFHDRDERGEPELPLLEVSINSGVVLREFSTDKIESTAADFNTYKVARKDDVVFNKMRMWQGAVGVAKQDGLVSADYTVAEPVGQLLPEFAELLFRTEMFSAECARRSHGITWDRLRLYWEGFREIEVPLPSQEEQSQIVTHVQNEVSRLEALRSATERTISLLRERRAALITAAVTGQIDIAAADK